jgi:hypothetical protein
MCALLVDNNFENNGSCNAVTATPMLATAEEGKCFLV